MPEYRFIHTAYIDGNGPLEALFDRVRAEGLYEAFFYAHQFDTASAFAEYLRAEAWAFLIERDGDLVGFAYLNSFTGKAGFFHFCVFRCGWLHTVEIAKAGLAWLKSERPVEVLIGRTPSSNRLAVRFAKRCGFKIIGTIPKAITLSATNTADDAVISYLELEDLK